MTSTGPIGGLPPTPAPVPTERKAAAAASEAAPKPTAAQALAGDHAHLDQAGHAPQPAEAGFGEVSAEHFLAATGGARTPAPSGAQIAAGEQALPGLHAAQARVEATGQALEKTQRELARGLGRFGEGRSDAWKQQFVANFMAEPANAKVVADLKAARTDLAGYVQANAPALQALAAHQVGGEFVQAGPVREALETLAKTPEGHQEALAFTKGLLRNEAYQDELATREVGRLAEGVVEPALTTLATEENARGHDGLAAARREAEELAGEGTAPGLTPLRELSTAMNKLEKGLDQVRAGNMNLKGLVGQLAKDEGELGKFGKGAALLALALAPKRLGAALAEEQFTEAAAETLSAGVNTAEVTKALVSAVRSAPSAEGAARLLPGLNVAIASLDLATDLGKQNTLSAIGDGMMIAGGVAAFTPAAGASPALLAGGAILKVAGDLTYQEPVTAETREAWGKALEAPGPGGQRLVAEGAGEALAHLPDGAAKQLAGMHLPPEQVERLASDPNLKPLLSDEYGRGALYNLALLQRFKTGGGQLDMAAWSQKLAQLPPAERAKSIAATVSAMDMAVRKWDMTHHATNTDWKMLLELNGGRGTTMKPFMEAAGYRP